MPVVACGRRPVVTGAEPLHIWQTLGLNERCSHHVEHPHILEVDCAACTFLMIVSGIKKKKQTKKGAHT